MGKKTKTVFSLTIDYHVIISGAKTDTHKILQIMDLGQTKLVRPKSVRPSVCRKDLDELHSSIDHYMTTANPYTANQIF